MRMLKLLMHTLLPLTADLLAELETMARTLGSTRPARPRVPHLLEPHNVRVPRQHAVVDYFPLDILVDLQSTRCTSASPAEPAEKQLGRRVTGGGTSCRQASSLARLPPLYPCPSPPVPSLPAQ